MNAYYGSIMQQMPYKEYRLCGGRMEGTRAIDISNGCGLELTILPDRGMDLYCVKFNGKVLNYIAPGGIVHPSYYNDRDKSWFDSAYLGFLTTCGFDNIGCPSEYQGEQHRQHGDISGIPAEQVNIEVHSGEEGPEIVVAGAVRDAKLFGRHFVLLRKITCKFASQDIIIEDFIQNNTYKKQPLMMLYHFNIGFPLLQENSLLHLPTKKVTGRDAYASGYLDAWREITAPQPEYREQCFYHELSCDEKEDSWFAVENPDENILLKVKYSKKHLDHFVQWKKLEKGCYVMGMEPCNATIEGIHQAQEDETLKFIEPMATITNRFVISVGKLA